MTASTTSNPIASARRRGLGAAPPSLGSTRPVWRRQFVRRLGALCVLAVLALGAMVVQLARLTVSEHGEHLAAAEHRLDRVRFLPTSRGRILDRNGRVLAIDRPSYDLALEWDFISGAWTARRAAKAAKASTLASGDSGAWRALGPAGRDAAIERALPAAEAEAEALLGAVARAGDLARDELEARIDEIRRRVHRRAVAVWDRQLELEQARFEDAEERFTPRPIQEHREAHVVIQALPDVMAFELTRLGDEWPGALEVQESTRRETPLASLEIDLDRSHLPRWLRSSKPIRVPVDGVADHLIGQLREKVFPSDVQRRPFVDPATGQVVDLAGYRPGLDRVGASGVEASQEDVLRGVRGMVRTRVDTGAEERIDAIPGRDVTLTIDIELQAVIQAILQPSVGLMRVQPWQSPSATDGSADAPDGGRPRQNALLGAVVVVDIESGEILAAVSTPSVADGAAMDDAAQAASHPYVNRAFEAPYPPGSILKPLVYLGAVGARAIPADFRVECNGHYVPDDPTRLRCWIYRERTGFSTHSAQLGGPLNAQQAVSRSCNIFFYSAANRLGAERMLAWLDQLGAGSALDAGLLWTRIDENGEREVVGEMGGFLPAAAGSLSPTDVIQMGIGQGPLAWTPVQAANALATLARGGAIRDAVVVRGWQGLPERRGRRARPDLQLDPRATSLALAGMREAVAAEHGTGHHITYDDGSRERVVDDEGLVVWGKTGTVQTNSPPDHAWYAGLVGPASEQRPKYAVAVIVEHGRSGGRAAGPVFNAVLHALRRLGYLPRLADPAEPGSHPDAQARGEPRP